MSSRLFRTKMAMSTRPPVMPHMITSMGEIYGYDSKTDDFQKLFNLGLASNAMAVRYSPDGRYLVICSGTTVAGSNMIYKRTPSGYIKLTLPTSPAAQSWYDAVFSPDSKYIYIVANTSVGYYYYHINDDDTLTSLTFAAVGLNARQISITNDGKYIAIGYTQAPYLNLYKVDNGVITKLNNTPTQPTWYSMRMAWIDHVLVFINSGSAGAYTFSIDASDGITRAATVGIDFYYTYSSAASKDGQYFMNCCLSGADYYKFDKTTLKFTKLLRYNSGIRALGASFSDDGTYVAQTYISGNQLRVYRRSGDILNEIAIPAPIVPTGGSLQDVCIATPAFV